MSYEKLWFSEFLRQWICGLETMGLLYKPFVLSDYFSFPKSIFSALQQRQEGGIFITTLQMRK